MPDHSIRTTPRTSDEPPALAASERIRQRLVAAGHRHHANDNIAAFIEDGEVDELRAEVEAKMRDVLHALVIDTVAITTRSRRCAASRDVPDRGVRAAATSRCPWSRNSPTMHG